MPNTHPEQANRHHGRSSFLVLLVAVVAVVALGGLVGCDPQASSSTGARPASARVHRFAHHVGHGDVPGELRLLPRDNQETGLGIADGEVPDDVTVFDSHYPAVTKLDPELLSALRSAATAAQKDGVQLHVASGWRSERYQAQLFQEAIAQYGSAEQAARWVARPGTSAHEAGQAVDLGPSTATSWLSQHGAAYGLCQIYSNEPWHYELRPAAVADGCPAMYADPTHDPRMQQ